MGATFRRSRTNHDPVVSDKHSGSRASDVFINYVFGDSCQGSPGNPTQGRYLEYWGVYRDDVGHDVDVHITRGTGVFDEAVNDAWIVPEIAIGIGGVLGVAAVVGIVRRLRPAPVTGEWAGRPWPGVSQLEQARHKRRGSVRLSARVLVVRGLVSTRAAYRVARIAHVDGPAPIDRQSGHRTRQFFRRIAEGRDGGHMVGGLGGKAAAGRCPRRSPNPGPHSGPVCESPVPGRSPVPRANTTSISGQPSAPADGTPIGDANTTPAVSVAAHNGPAIRRMHTPCPRARSPVSLALAAAL